MRISDWSSDVCSSDLTAVAAFGRRWAKIGGRARRSSWLPRILGECFLHVADRIGAEAVRPLGAFQTIKDDEYDGAAKGNQADQKPPSRPVGVVQRSEEHTSELQSLMRISYAVLCLKQKNST